MAEINLPSGRITTPDDVPPVILRAIQIASTTQNCSFVTDLVDCGSEFAIEAMIGPSRRPIGAVTRKPFRVRFLIPSTFPYAVVETIPIDPPLKWHPHQLGDWPPDLERHANVICPPRLSDLYIDQLLLPYIRHARRWIDSALDNNLIREDERYEMPHIAPHLNEHPRFLIEGGTGPFTFVTANGRGVAALRKVRTSTTFDLFRVAALFPRDSMRADDTWQSSIRTNAFGEEDESVATCPWFHFGNPVIDQPHKPPVLWEDIPRRSQLHMLRAVAAAAQSWTVQPFMLIAFSIPTTWAGEPDRIAWSCLALSGFKPDCFQQPPGFRPRKIALWPKVQRFVRENANLKWLDCEDISPLARRSRAISTIPSTAFATAIIGAGSLGSMLAKSLSKAEVGPILVVDSETLVPGNLVRHEATPPDVFRAKAQVMQEHCQTASKDANVTFEIGNIVRNWQDLKGKLTRCDLIIDATGDRGVHEFLSSQNDLRDKLLGFCYMTPGPDYGTLILRTPASALRVEEAEERLLDALDQESRKRLVEDSHNRENLVWPEPGCYHPTFRAPFHRVRMMADSMVATMLDWTHQVPRTDIITVFQQTTSDHMFGCESRILKQIPL